jgi:hypothetical protein
VNCKWIFKTKYNANGFVARTEVHLATMGFSQVEDINFNETLSLIAQMESIQNLFIVQQFNIPRCIKWITRRIHGFCNYPNSLGFHEMGQILINMQLV